MSHFILIVILSAPNGTSTVSMQDFNTLEACQYAANEISRKVGSYQRGSFCVSKGVVK